MKNLRYSVGTALLVAALAIGPAALASTAPAGANDATIQARLVHKLQQKKEFKNVKSTVEDGTVTLTGSVQTYRQKLDAEKLARHSSKSEQVRDLIVVSSTVPDATLRQNLATKLAYDRVGYYDNPFNVFTLKVKDGVVTLGGEAADYPSYNDALAIVQNAKGVKGVVNEVKVAPVSIFDNNLRWRLYRAIYGDTVLSKYALDPAKPIRILVNNGHIALYGHVDNKMDATIADMRARQVFGGFSVQNHLTTGQTDVAE